MKKFPTVRIVYGRRNSQTKSGEQIVEIEIAFQGKRKWITTGVKVKPKNWSKSRKIIGRPDAIDLNLKIEKLEDFINNYIRKLMINEQEFSWNGLQNILNYGSSDSFIEFIKKRIASRQDKAPNTIKNYKVFYNSIKESGIINTFADLNKQNILRYDEWLRARRKYNQSTIAGYHKFLKVFINDAIKLEYISKSPYQGIKIDRGRSVKRRYIKKEELRDIENADLPTKSLERVRDVFIFQCYTGLAYVDLQLFDFSKVIKSGQLYILNDVRRKTGEEFYIVILPKAINILKKYDYKLPLISNQQYNMRLKLVALYAGIEERLTSHMGRHTYATMCINAGVKIEVLAQMMGHSDIKTTQIYAKLVNKTVEDAYAMLEKKLSE